MELIKHGCKKRQNNQTHLTKEGVANMEFPKFLKIFSAVVACNVLIGILVLTVIYITTNRDAKTEVVALHSAVCFREFICKEDSSQVGYDVGHTKQRTKDDCAKRCCEHSSCVGFDYGKNNDCWLTRTLWKDLPTVSVMHRTSCEMKPGNYDYHIRHGRMAPGADWR